jgi:mannan endo-1,4-beta-mannosidase
MHTLQKKTLKRLKEWQFILLVLISLISCNMLAQSSSPIDVVEAENGILVGVTIGNSIAGFSGTGYVTGFDNSSDRLTVTVNTPERGLYNIVIRYNSPNGDKTQYLSINGGFSSSVTFPKTSTYQDLDVGAYILEKGANTISIQSYWGWMDIDKFTIYATAPHVYNISHNLVDPDANAPAVALYSFLKENFGKKIISGQTDSNFDILVNTTGQIPMLKASDFQHYTAGYPYLWQNGGHTFGWDDNGNTESMIDWYNKTGKKGIVSFQWHWHSPFGGQAGTNTFYSDKTTFDVSKAVQTGTAENIAILKDIDSIATQLKKLQNAGVPVLWRPLHEAGGAWFWWGAKGPDACKQLYNIVFDRLKNYHGLHNLVWVWSSPEASWYPGNDKVDIIGYDSYPGEFNYGIQKTIFDQLFKIVNGEKLIAMSENGPIPNPDDCLLMDAAWSYFMSWSDLVIAQNEGPHLLDVFYDKDVLTLGYSSNPVLKVLTNNLSIGAQDNSKQSFNIFSNLDWTATSSKDWLSIDKATGTGNDMVTLTATANTGSQRVASITVSGSGVQDQVLTITQQILTSMGLMTGIEKKIDIYPNPNHGAFRVCLNHMDGIGFHLYLMNQSGAIMDEFEKRNPGMSFSREMNLPNLPKGLYFLVVLANNKKFIGKVVIN